MNVTDASSSSNIVFTRKCDQEVKTKNKQKAGERAQKVLREKQSSKIFRIYVLVGTIPQTSDTALDSRTRLSMRQQHKMASPPFSCQSLPSPYFSSCGASLLLTTSKTFHLAS